MMNEEKSLTNVPVDIAKDMVGAYTREASGLASYTKAVWFPAEQILRIAKSIEDGKHDGLRIYFGQYTANALDGVPKDYLGRNTVLLVPTLSGVTGGSGDEEEHQDDLGDIENKGESCPPVCQGTNL